MNTIFSHKMKEEACNDLISLPLLSDTRVRAHNIMTILAVCMAVQMTSFVLILPLFARRLGNLGSGVEALGISAMAYALTSTLLAPFMGGLADRFGRRPVVLASLVAYVLAFSGYLFATSAWMFIVVRGLAGAFTAGLMPSIISTVGDLAPASRRAQWIGIVNGGASAGWIIGPLLGGILYDRSGHAAPFIVSIVLAVATFVIALFLIPETNHYSSKLPAKNFSWSNWMNGFRTLRSSLPQSLPMFLMLMTIGFGVMFAWAFIEPQFMFYAYDDLQWTSTLLGAVMSTYGVTMMLGEFTLSRLSDRWGRRPVLILGLALFSAQFIGLALFHDVTWIVLSFVLAGLGNAIYDPALNAHLLDIAPTEHKARIMGIKSTVSSLGNMLGPALVVLFIPYLKPQGVFLTAAFLVLFLTFSSWFSFRALGKT